MKSWNTKFVKYGGYDCMTDALHIEEDGQTIAVLDFKDYGQKACDYDFLSVEAHKNAELLKAAPLLKEAIYRLLINPNDPDSASFARKALLSSNYKQP